MRPVTRCTSGGVVDARVFARYVATRPSVAAHVRAVRLQKRASTGSA